MTAMLLGLSLLCGAGFVFLSGRLLSRRWPTLARRLLRSLQASGRRSLGLSAFQAQHALAFAGGHALVVAAGGAVAWLASGSAIGGAGAALLLHLLPARWFAWQRDRRRRAIESELPEALRFMAGALRAGSALSVAMQVLVRDQPGPLGHEFGLVLKDQRLGMSFDDAIQKMSRRIGLPDFVLVVVALRISKEVGGNLSEPLQVLAETLRRKAVLEGRIRALTAQGRIQGIVMTLFPVFLLGVLCMLQPGMVLIFTTTLGRVVLAVAAVMLALGYAAIRRIVAIDI